MCYVSDTLPENHCSSLLLKDKMIINIFQLLCDKILVMLLICKSFG